MPTHNDDTVIHRDVSSDYKALGLLINLKLETVKNCAHDEKAKINSIETASSADETDC